eukprot:COSAG04_NODE_842_length_9945_cov_4.243043_13_plen_276_part_01
MSRQQQPPQPVNVVVADATVAAHSHEFPAMIQRLESSFTGTLHHSEANNAAATDGHNGDGAVSVGQPSVEVESSLRQKLKEQEELLAERDQRIRELEAAADEKRSATLQRKKSKKKKHRAVSRAFIAGVWVAFFQRVPAMIMVRAGTGPRERLGAGAEAEQPAAPQRSAAAQGGAHEHRLRRPESFGRSAAGAAKRARASAGATGAAGAAGELAGVRRVLTECEIHIEQLEGSASRLLHLVVDRCEAALHLRVSFHRRICRGDHSVDPEVPRLIRR